MAVFCQLAAPERYVPCTWDMLTDAEGRQYWLGHFETHIESALDLALAQLGGADDGRIAACRAEFLAGIRRLYDEPDAFGELNILVLDDFRSRMLRKHGFDDPYREIKRKEDDEALGLYPEVVAEINALPASEKMPALLRGVFAGNIFDLGSKATLEHYHAEGLDFSRTRRSLRPRPWLVDDADAWCSRFEGGRSPYAHILFFVDNAGADIVLGCLPLARQLALDGGRVVLAANDLPCLNDITVAELGRVVDEAAGADPVLADLAAGGRIALIGTGNGTPLIDLRTISDPCNEAARKSDLLILEGMGRSVESNFEAAFRCDCLKIAMVKDKMVAARLGGEVFDLICRFDQAGR